MAAGQKAVMVVEHNMLTRWRNASIEFDNILQGVIHFLTDILRGIYRMRFGRGSNPG